MISINLYYWFLLGAAGLMILQFVPSQSWKDPNATNVAFHICLFFFGLFGLIFSVSLLLAELLEKSNPQP